MWERESSLSGLHVQQQQKNRTEWERMKMKQSLTFHLISVCNIVSPCYQVTSPFAGSPWIINLWPCWLVAHEERGHHTQTYPHHTKPHKHCRGRRHRNRVHAWASQQTFIQKKKKGGGREVDRLGYRLGWAGACTNPIGFSCPFSGTFYLLCRLLWGITPK